MSSRFDAEFYSLYRPFYPAETFAGLEGARAIADIGCGTGHSTLSLLRAGIKAQVVGVDPDPKMLELARVLAGSEFSIEWRLGSGESTGLGAQSQDAVIVGSAFHWMKPELAQEEFRRVLKPGGVLRIFEYQFPKAPELPELNEWIRREFNLKWKAPDQKPRGNLKELTSVFRNHPEAWSYRGEVQPKMEMQFGFEDLAGLLLSQSRVLHYEDTLSAHEKESFHQSLRTQLESFFKVDRTTFDFKLAIIDFTRSRT